MGYETTFKLSWECYRPTPDKPACEHAIPKDAKFCPTCGTPVGIVTPDKQIERAIEQWQEKNTEWAYGITPQGESIQPCMWYDHERDISELSKRFPTILFTLSGEGEESGDIWAKYFLNGKYYKEKARIMVEPFSIEKLNRPAKA